MAVRVVEAVRIGSVTEGCAGSTSAGVGAAFSDSTSFLMVRRPEGGLLAGLWEFPSVVMPTVEKEAAAATAEDRAAAVQALVDSLSIPGLSSHTEPGGESKSRGDARATNHKESRDNTTSIGPRSVGQVVHVFSHIRQTMAVEHLVVTLEGEAVENGGGEGSKGDSPEWRWVQSSDMEAAGLTSGVRKVYDLVLKGGKGNNGTAKGKGKGTGKGRGSGKQAAGDEVHTDSAGVSANISANVTANATANVTASGAAAAVGKPEESAIGKMFAKQQQTKRQKTK